MTFAGAMKKAIELASKNQGKTIHVHIKKPNEARYHDWLTFQYNGPIMFPGFANAEEFAKCRYKVLGV